MGVLLAYMFFGRGSAKQSAGGAAIIHFPRVVSTKSTSRMC